MRKIFTFFIILAIWPGVVLFGQGQLKNHIDPVSIEGVVTRQDLKPVAVRANPVAVKALSNGEKPGEFKNVSYSFAGNVRALKASEKSQISLKEDGILDLTGKTFVPDPDTVYIDPQSDLIFQTEPVDETRMIILRPKMSAVFDDIEIPLQEVKVTLANTVSMAEGIVASALQTGGDYAVNLQFDSIKFLLDEAKEGTLTATLVGQVLLTNPRVEGKYSKNGGYQLVFKTSEQVDLKVYTTVKAKKEIKEPIWGTVINAGDLGKCELGLFLLINMEGEVTLAFEIHQGLELSLGAKGSTFYYIPTSIRNISELEQWCDINYSIQAKMKAFAGLQTTANLKIKGYNALDVYVNGGMEGTVETDGSTLDADIGFRIKAGGKVVSKKFTLVDKYYSLWKLQQPDYKGFNMFIHEACAYGDYVVGEIHSIVDSKTVSGLKDTVPYSGSLNVIVKHPDSKTNQYPAQSDAKGVFVARNVPLKKGDIVMIKLPEVALPSPAIAATIPFMGINLYAADYYAGVAEGSVAGSKSEWAKLANMQAAGQVPGGIKDMLQNSPAGKIKGTLPKSEIIKRLDEFKNNLIVYRGPVEFIIQQAPVMALQPGVRTQAQGTRTAPAAAEKAAVNMGTVNSPLGSFNVSGLKFEPGQKVKARIQVEGFTVESEWVETEGLMVSEIEHDRLQFAAGQKTESFSAQNSFVVVSAIRSETNPTGTVKMVKGVDAAHASLTMAKAVPEFPEARKAIIWFTGSVSLKPLAGYPGTSIAETGPWSVTSGYSSPGDVINPAKNRKHPFEMVTYVYKNKDLGYSFFVDECASCTSPSNVVDRIGTMINPGIPLQQKIVVPVKKAPVIQGNTGKF